MVAGVVFDEVTKVYTDGTKAVSGLSLDVGDGEFMVLVGPSGCGKTTALRMVAGLEDISSGVVRIGERTVNHVPSRDRDIAMVFQSYALYPHLSIYENIAFGLKVKKVPKQEIERRVQNAAKVLGLEPFLKRKPRALSGGQRQRVAMGRAIVREPAAFLMDEPLSNLDAKLRVQMRAEIAGLQRSLETTTIYVTHDQVEAMTMGDRIVVMDHGVLRQAGTPEELYTKPRNLFVAGFIGSPAKRRRAAGHPSEAEHRSALARYVGRDVVLGIRPEDLQDAALVPDSPARLRGTTELTEALGSEIVVHFKIAARHAVTEDVRELAEDVGDEARVDQLAQEDTATLVGRFGARSRARAGDKAEVAVDTRSLHFFDPETGLGIYEGQSTKGAAS